MTNVKRKKKQETVNICLWMKEFRWGIWVENKQEQGHTRPPLLVTQ